MRPMSRLKGQPFVYTKVTELTHVTAGSRMPDLRASDAAVSHLTTVTELPGPRASKPGRSICGAVVSRSPANAAGLAGRATVEPAV